MAKKTEQVEMTQEDMEEAISDWLHSKYGPPKANVGPGIGKWQVRLHHQSVYDGDDVFQATATRETGV